MPYGAYKQRVDVTVDAGVTLAVDNPLGRVPDEVLIERHAGDAALELDNWAVDGTTFDATNPGAAQNSSTLVLVYNHSLTK